MISIHAPAKGATKKNLLILSAFQISIHAPAKGATVQKNHCYVVTLFQSTLPRRERHGTAIFILNVSRISIHAPAKGATQFSPLWLNLQLFQSTLPRRERRWDSNFYFKCFTYFNPRSREGSDIPITASNRAQVISIHAPAKGATIIFDTVYLC